METSLETITNLNARENTAKIVSTTKKTLTKCVLQGACLTFAGVTQVFAQENPRDIAREHETVTTPVQIVALDECDPKTFNDALA